MKALEILIEMEGSVVKDVYAFHRNHPSYEPNQELPVIYVFDHDHAQMHPEEEQDISLKPLEYSRNAFPHSSAEDKIREHLGIYRKNLFGED